MCVVACRASLSASSLPAAQQFCCCHTAGALPVCRLHRLATGSCLSTLPGCPIQVGMHLLGGRMTYCCWSCQGGLGRSPSQLAQHPARAVARPCALAMGGTLSSMVGGTTSCWTQLTCWT